MRSYDDKIISCPYNKNHKMPAPRLVWHLSMGKDGNGCYEKKKYGHLY